MRTIRPIERLRDRGLSRGLRISAKIFCLALVAALFSMGEIAAGGHYLQQKPGGPPLVEISAEVRAHCSATVERTLGDEVKLEVLHPPELKDLAVDSLAMMEKVHDALIAEMGITIKTGSCLYLVQMPSYPESIQIVDDLTGTAMFVFVGPEASDAEHTRVLESGIYGTLAHEWSHHIFEERFGRDSGLWRARWITEGLGTLRQYLAGTRLSLEVLDECRSRHLPSFNLEETSLKAMVRWKYPRKLPPKDVRDEESHYGAALGLFLRVKEAGGTGAVLALLDEVKDKRRIREEDLQAALVKITGRTYGELARTSSEERKASYREALDALDGPGRWRRLYGLAVLGKFPERIDQHRAKVEALVGDTGIDEGVRAEAKRLLAPRS